jgi:outer membrane protein OmpA-like peptidoglycan-associated protein
MNLGEVVLDGDHSKLLSTTELQAFALIVTAEPYFAVTQPSDVVVMENIVRNDTTGTIQQVDAKYDLLQRGQYVRDKSRYQPVKIDHKGPLQLAEAQNAIQIAKLAGAEKYAPDTLAKATLGYQNAEAFLLKSKDRKRSETNAREATQMAEDARIITYRKIREEQLAAERAAAAEREAAANAEASRQAEQARLSAEQARLEEQRRAKADADRMSAERAKAEADEARRQAELASAKAAQDRAAADAARAEAIAQQQALAAEAERAKLAANQAEQARAQSEREKAELRQRLLQQLNAILETRETQRGLIINISDVLFDTGKYTLKPGAREKLAKVSGIVLAYPGLRLQAEGHTDSVGGEEYNQKLSENRAGAVRDYLAQQGLPASSLTAVGYGKSQPVASNDTASGRQQNRRVELVVSGEVIGTQFGTSTSTSSFPSTTTTPR